MIIFLVLIYLIVVFFSVASMFEMGCLPRRGEMLFWFFGILFWPVTPFIIGIGAVVFTYVSFFLDLFKISRMYDLKTTCKKFYYTTKAVFYK